MFSNKTVKISQIVLYPFMHLFFKIFFKTKLIIEEKFDKDTSYIFTPNHLWNLDPFLIFYLMPFRELYKLFPVRFLTADKYLNNKFNRLFLGLLGCYGIEDSIKKSIYF